MRLRRYLSRLRCAVGLHDLVSYADAGDGVHVVQLPPRRIPGPDASRKCRYCDSRWEGRYDGMGGMWVKVRGPVWTRPVPTIPMNEKGQRT